MSHSLETFEHTWSEKSLHSWPKASNACKYSVYSNTEFAYCYKVFVGLGYCENQPIVVYIVNMVKQAIH